MIKILIGGSPCTYWSVAQQYNRETEASGMGWELFKNYLIAKEKFAPDYFLYENNKTAAKPIKEQISRELGVDLMYIDSALVSAQHRCRFYAFNWEVEQPEDRNVSFQDIKDTDPEYCRQFKVKRTPSRERMWSNGDSAGGRMSCKNITNAIKTGAVTTKQDRCPNSGLIEFEDFCRFLTTHELEQLQTMPIGYTDAISRVQQEKALGNGWTAEVIIHILNGVLKDVPRDEEIVVLSMYDGIGTGRYCLDKMGFTNVTYYAYEIDEHAMKVAMSNYPDIIQLGDAFNLRRDDWELGKRYDDAPPTAKDPAGGQEEQEEHHEHIHSESGADTATKTPTAGADTVRLDGETLQRSEDPEGVRDLAEGKEEPPREGGDVSAEEAGAPSDVLAQFVKETLDEFLKRSIIKKLTTALKNAGVEPEQELLDRLNSSTLKEVGAVAVAFPGYITAAILARDIKEGTEE